MLKAGDGGIDQIVERDRTTIEGEVGAFEPGEEQKVADQTLQAVRLGLDDPAGLLVVDDRSVGECLCIALDRGEWGAEIVAHGHEELAFKCVRSLEVVGHRVDRGDQLADLVSAGGCPVGDPGVEVTGGDASGDITGCPDGSGERPADASGDERGDDDGRQRGQEEPMKRRHQKRIGFVGHHDDLLGAVPADVPARRPEEVSIPVALRLAGSK